MFLLEVNIFESILLPFLILLGVFIQFHFFRAILFYYDSHLTETKLFFEKQDMDILEIKKPQYSDWKRNPLMAKDISPFRLKIFPEFHFIQHSIVYVLNKKDGLEKNYWRQVKSNFFKKGEIQFLEEIKENYQIDDSIIVTNQCPACLSEIKLNDDECPKCGLSFS